MIVESPRLPRKPLTCADWKRTLRLGNLVDNRYQNILRADLQKFTWEILATQRMTRVRGYLPTIPGNLLEQAIVSDAWEDYRSFITTLYTLLTPKFFRLSAPLHRITDVGTEGDTLIFPLLGVRWDGFNPEQDYEFVCSLKHEMVANLAQLGQLDSNFDTNMHFFGRKLTPVDCRAREMDLVFLRNTLHHLGTGEDKWELLNTLHRSAKNGVFIVEKVLSEDDDEGKLLSISEIQRIQEEYKPYCSTGPTSEDLKLVILGKMTEEEFLRNHQQAEDPSNMVVIFLRPPPKLSRERMKKEKP